MPPFSGEGGKENGYRWSRRKTASKRVRSILMSNLPNRQGWPRSPLSSRLVTGKTETIPGLRSGALVLLAPETLRPSFGISHMGRGS